MNENNAAKRLERSVYAHKGLTTDELKLFENYMRERVQIIIADIDDWLGRLDTPEESEPDVPRYVAGLSVFQYIDDHTDTRELGDLLGE